MKLKLFVIEVHGNFHTVYNNSQLLQMIHTFVPRNPVYRDRVKEWPECGQTDTSSQADGRTSGQNQLLIK